MKSANATGAKFEADCAAVLESRGFVRSKLTFDRRGSLAAAFGQHVHVGSTIYGRKRYADFLVSGAQDYPQGLVLECKWQESAGSADEKYPFLCANIAKTRTPTIVLLDGGGYSTGASEWFRAQAGVAPYLEAVMTGAEFAAWALRLVPVGLAA